MALLLLTKLSAMGFPPAFGTRIHMIVASIVAALTWCLSVLVPQALWQHQASSKSWAVCSRTPAPPIKPTLANSAGERAKGKKIARDLMNTLILLLFLVSIWGFYILKKIENLVGCCRCWTYRHQSLKFKF